MNDHPNWSNIYEISWILKGRKRMYRFSFPRRFWNLPSKTENNKRKQKTQFISKAQNQLYKLCIILPPRLKNNKIKKEHQKHDINSKNYLSAQLHTQSKPTSIYQLQKLSKCTVTHTI